MKLLKTVLFSFGLLVTANCFSQTSSWYKRLSGSIDKYAVTMHLHKMGNVYEGAYYYNNTQQPVSFKGNDTAVAGKIQLLAYTAGTGDYETFTFNIENNAASGEWKKDAKTDALAFTATEVKDSSLVPFIFVYTQGSVKLKTGLKESPEATFSAASVWPSLNNAKANFIKQAVRKNFDKKISSQEIGAILLKQKKQFFAGYKKEYADVTDKDLQERSYGCNMEAIKSLMVLYQTSSLLSLAHSGYSYTGGAHGNHGTSYINLNLATKRRLLLDDVLARPSKPALNKLLAKYYKKQYLLAANASLKEAGLFEEKIEATDNFYVTGKGIGFVYSPYEIAPYAMGEINIFIPFSELGKYIQPNFKKLVN